MSNRLIRKIISRSDEAVYDIIRPALWSRFWQIILAVILINLPFFLIYPLFLRGYWGVAIFAALLMIALFYLLRLYYGRYYTALLITNKRLIDASLTGFFNFSVLTILYGKIQDVDYKSKGLLKTILKIGDIYITFIKDQETLIKLASIKNPHQVVEMIIEQRDRYLREKREVQGQEAIRILAGLKKKLGEEKFNQLIYH
ncbi:MAG: hypothetical protein A3B89_03490 [Candidatus Buchananbacteria bacterium RIFCSPHIGHO2_02_FULL_40_13]|uniref:Uncharacterized protein n=1 Tax=Candidatus Buchananbacteria bacterium RIFCSPLOWO2_01_FULL_39_33 TaxID=1797543 RepID=A0A1G1YIW2_9BACT|nr:MAG: hypothetical protein A3B89_03490 [Candidatus Buchananbacteria bacterium RIFCSPHIGHO2_02_FULL_40_13]OGY51766.1 MAG: hypothetical protein A3A02_04005 [Candidatus Buchananbacteria bacterium RIFCSPLOWO2_01_FULL_39_33]